MPAAMAVTAGDQRALFGETGFLAKAGKGVVFAKDGNDRTAFARFAHHRCRHACDIADDPKTFRLKLCRMRFTGRKFLVIHLWCVPYLVGEAGIIGRLVVDEFPDGVGIFHAIGLLLTKLVPILFTE
ncbi:hypothetical protein D3C87_1701530 [compost metagenome]